MPSTTQPSAAHEVIESVVHLTEQRDELTLLKSLQASILEVLPDVAVSMLSLVPATERGQWVLEPECPLPEPMFPVTDDLVAEASRLNGDELIRLHAAHGRHYLISSLGLRADRRKSIVISRSHWSATDRQIAEGMLKIYANYARVLFDSERDTLTGLYNRKKLDQKLSELLAARISGYHREGDEGTSDYLAVLDIDHFKRINDNYGHLIGDEVLIIFAGLVRNALRDVDWVFRYGGEEFVVLVKRVSPETIRTIMERIRVKVQNHLFPQVGQATVSIGYTPIINQALPPYVFEEADKALYFAKEHGRNQAQDYRDLVARGAIAAEEHASGSVDLF